MNYYKELFYHCFRSIFNHFDKPYCSKWDRLLTEILDNYDEVTIKGNPFSYHKEICTVLFKHKGKEYTIWVANGFYGVDSLYALDDTLTKHTLQKRPSFNNQFRLLKMICDYKADKANKDKLQFEQELYGE